MFPAYELRSTILVIDGCSLSWMPAGDVQGIRRSIIRQLMGNAITNDVVLTRWLYDAEQRGYLSVPTMIKCIGEVVTSVHSPESPWRLLLNSMAPKGEFIEYKRLFALIQKARQPEVSEETIPELLTLEEDEISFKATAEQKSRQMHRAQVMTEIEVLLMRNPELSLDRLKTATTQKVIEQSEFKLLLEMYGLEEAFRPFYQRLVSCFLTHDNKIHFSAFLGCLSLVRLPVQRPPSVAPVAPWSKPALGPIPSKRND